MYWTRNFEQSLFFGCTGFSDLASYSRRHVALNPVKRTLDEIRKKDDAYPNKPNGSEFHEARRYAPVYWCDSSVQYAGISDCLLNSIG